MPFLPLRHLFHTTHPPTCAGHAPAPQSMILLILGPFIDRWVSNRWLLEWEVNVPGLQMLGLSCVLAIGVNVTQVGRGRAHGGQARAHTGRLC